MKNEKDAVCVCVCVEMSGMGGGQGRDGVASDKGGCHRPLDAAPGNAHALLTSAYPYATPAQTPDAGCVLHLDKTSILAHFVVSSYVTKTTRSLTTRPTAFQLQISTRHSPWHCMNIFGTGWVCPGLSLINRTILRWRSTHFG